MKWWNKLLIVTALIGAVIFIVEHKKRQGMACSAEGCILPPGDEAPTAAPLAPAATQDKPLPKLLDLGAGKCIPCKMMTPILDEMKETYAGQLEVEFIDVWENKAEAEKFGISSIPTQIFFDAEGKELFRHVGFYPREDMIAKWKELGVNLSNE